ncbi:hypothetical protein [Glutamicibacter sp. NPDC127525]|uniref:hypothetical protein n=1 Tax=unclassified Glutamicibacter TaxID=2627139 RepID=UPI00364348A0
MNEELIHLVSDQLSIPGFTFVDSFIARCTALTASTTSNIKKVTCQHCLRAVAEKTSGTVTGMSPDRG